MGTEVVETPSAALEAAALPLGYVPDGLWREGEDSNLRDCTSPTFKADAVDRTEPPSRLEPTEGIEPPTCGLRNRRTASVLCRQR